MPSNEEIDNLTEQLCAAYTRRRQRDFARFKLRAEDEAKLRELAGSLLTEGIALHYLEWAYDFYRSGRPVVYVLQIASPKTRQIYRDKIPNVSKEVSLEVSLQIDTLKTQLALGRDAREIITDPHLELGSLFRYALARKAQLDELAEQFREDAVLATRTHPLYAEFLMKFTGSTE